MAIELIPLAIASAFWPLLLAVVIISLRTAHPPRLLVSFLAGGLLTTMTVGLIIIYALEHSSLVSRSRSTTDPAVDLGGRRHRTGCRGPCWRGEPIRIRIA